MFHMDVAKIDHGVAHIAMATQACFKGTFQVFHLFQTYVANVSYGCFKVGRDAAHIATAIHVCCKSLFKIFHLFFPT